MQSRGSFDRQFVIVGLGLVESCGKEVGSRKWEVGGGKWEVGKW